MASVPLYIEYIDQNGEPDPVEDEPVEEPEAS